MNPSPLSMLTRPSARARTALLACGLCALAAAPALGARPAAHHDGVRAGAKRVTVRLAEFTLKPAPRTAGAGSVTFTVRNAGKVRHEFVVLRTTKRANRLLKGDEASEAGNVGEIPRVNAGQTKKLTVRLKAGHYALICNLPGHYKAGQRADLTVS